MRNSQLTSSWFLHARGGKNQICMQSKNKTTDDFAPFGRNLWFPRSVVGAASFRFSWQALWNFCACINFLWIIKLRLRHLFKRNYAWNCCITKSCLRINGKNKWNFVALMQPPSSNVVISTMVAIFIYESTKMSRRAHIINGGSSYQLWAIEDTTIHGLDTPNPL